ncbi:MAG: hypothetical protein ACRD3S_01890 [Terracidiphilus sp.]
MLHSINIANHWPLLGCALSAHPGWHDLLPDGSAPAANNRNENSIPKSLELKAGELVEVRSQEEILSTLDKNGCLDGMPFMPEMFAFCGKRLPVYKRAHKTCDTICWSGSRRIVNAVHLEDARCNGQAHGGCQADCLIFWKEAWLKRATPVPVAQPNRGPLPRSAPADIAGCTENDVVAKATKTGGAATDEPIYVCQATQLWQASSPLKWWDLRQYWEDYTSGNFSLKWMLGVLCYANYNALMNATGNWHLRKPLTWIYNTVQKLRRRSSHPRAKGRIPSGAPTPIVKLDLQPGEMVRVKSFETIRDTIDQDYRNRGMKWDAEMVPHCNRIYRVRKRVQKLIDEKTGKMQHLKSEPIILDGAICQSRYSEHRYFCPRAIFPYWREIWLERIPPDNSKKTPPEKS